MTDKNALLTDISIINQYFYTSSHTNPITRQILIIISFTSCIDNIRDKYANKTHLKQCVLEDIFDTPPSKINLNLKSHQLCYYASNVS